MIKTFKRVTLISVGLWTVIALFISLVSIKAAFIVLAIGITLFLVLRICLLLSSIGQ